MTCGSNWQPFYVYVYDRLCRYPTSSQQSLKVGVAIFWTLGPKFVLKSKGKFNSHSPPLKKKKKCVEAKIIACPVILSVEQLCLSYLKISPFKLLSKHFMIDKSTAQSSLGESCNFVFGRGTNRGSFQRKITLKWLYKMKGTELQATAVYFLWKFGNQHSPVRMYHQCICLPCILSNIRYDIITSCYV